MTKTTKPIQDPDAGNDVAGSAEKKNNIKFCGRDQVDRKSGKVLRVADPIDRYSDRGEIVKLPPADWQKRYKVFYHESATAIAKAFPHLYKIIRSK